MNAGVPRNVLEKDYALSYVLAGIAQVPDLYTVALFKGGTCLRKAYFQDYRFSIDLDFTLTRRVSSDQLAELVSRAATRAMELLTERGAFEVASRPVAHGQEHERGQCEFKVDVRYPWMRQSIGLKVELLPSPPEVLVGQVQERKLLHVGFDEQLEVTLRCYELREIVAEKLRGFLQSRRRFDELAAGQRSFARSRPRDLFDLSYLFKQDEHQIDWGSVRKFLEPKAIAYEVRFEGPDDFLDERVIDAMRRDWDAQLGEFITPLQGFDDCLATYKRLLATVFSAS